MSLSDKLKGVTPADLISSDPFGVFAPLLTESRNQTVFITSWGIGNPDQMWPVMNALALSKRVSILVGYSKTTHNLVNMLEVCRAYLEQDIEVRLLPSFHTKLWVIGSKAWVGSCNFVPSTVVNHVWAVPVARVKRVIECYWPQAATISSSTDLSLIPQARYHA